MSRFENSFSSFFAPLVFNNGCGKDGNCVWRTPSCPETQNSAWAWADAFRRANTRTRTQRHRQPQGVTSLRLTGAEHGKDIRDRKPTTHTIWVIFSPVEGAGSILEMTQQGQGDVAHKTSFPLLRASRKPRSWFYFQFGNREEQGANLSSEDGNIFSTDWLCSTISK